MTLMQWFREYIFFPVSTSQAARKLSAAAGRLAGKKAAGKVPVYLASLTCLLYTSSGSAMMNCATMPMNVEVGGATIFVIDVEDYEKI